MYSSNDYPTTNGKVNSFNKITHWKIKLPDEKIGNKGYQQTAAQKRGKNASDPNSYQQ
ncbi:hypothetical protein EcWSU1_00073 [Enterobacter ludwigii]|uniref:Uncharacterized protein n=1 Tax=Enterobacter ludwigii TaxID=299767 RepID=G8LFM8_9ENTR|nr:hypothetical protein EcWSU1_00073 [Enterobacter ludwigii]